MTSNNTVWLIEMMLLYAAVAGLVSANNVPCREGQCSLTDVGNNTDAIPEDVHILDCTLNADCEQLLNNSLCRNSKCSCLAGFIHEDDTTCRPVLLGDNCSSSIDCSSTVKHSSCSDGYCRCNKGYEPQAYMKECIQQFIGDSCAFSIDCIIDNSECFNGICSCPAGFRSSSNNTKCAPTILHDFCENDIDCSTVNASHCTLQGVCDCDKGYIQDETLTLCRPRVLNDLCMTSSDCYTSVTHSVCKRGRCECKHGFHSTVTLDECVLKRVGDTCTSHMDCLLAVDSTQCLENVCTCLTGYMAVLNNSKCVRRSLTSPCALDVDCTTFIMNSTCANGTCNCVSGLKQVGDANICERRLLGEDCQVDSDCSDSVDKSRCYSGSCDCSLGYRYVDDDTCVIRHIGDACAKTADCSNAVESSHCSNDTCACNQGYKVTLDTLKCNLNSINDACKVNNDCSKAVSDSFCKDGACKCNTGFQVSDDFTTCNRRKIYDKTCVFHKDCSAVISDSRCNKYECVCSAGFYPSSDNQTCVKFRVGDRGCQEARKDCKLAVRSSHCVFETCECVVGYMAVDNRTTCSKRVIGDPCDKRMDCKKAVYDSDCLDSTCTCIGDLEPTPDLNTCVPKPIQLLRDSCFFDGQCERITHHSFCKKLFDVSYIRSCVCKEGYIFRNDRQKAGECYVPEKIGDYCKSLDWCRKRLRDNVVCNNNTCGCRSGHVPNRNSDGCVPYARKIGEFCWTDEHCEKIPNSVCDPGLSCKCHFRYEPGPTNTTCIRSRIAYKPEVPNITVGPACDKHDSRACSEDEEAVKYTRCGHVVSDGQSRCGCVPGYASRYDSEIFNCVDADTYLFTVYISAELGCNRGHDDEELRPLCYKYQPISFLEEYNTPGQSMSSYIRKRIELNGMSKHLMDTSPEIKRRYLTSEVINITETYAGLQVTLIMYIASEKYVIIEPKTLQYHIVQNLLRGDGELGTSQLRVTRPFSENVEYKDFDECTEQDGLFNDCSHLSWCINTRNSYMCSCKYINVIDTSPDVDNRPGRICSVPIEEPKHSLSCSNTKCETQWEYIGLGLVALMGLLFTFIGYEIYARKKELEKTDMYYAFHRASKKAKLKAQELHRKTIKARKGESQRRNEHPHVTFDVDAPEHVI